LIFKLSIDVPEIEKKVPQPKAPSVKVWRLKLNPHPKNIPKLFFSNVETETKVTLRARAAVLSMWPCTLKSDEESQNMSI
jgi:hypothetical protein